MSGAQESSQALPRKLVTRRKLLKAARDLFLEKGFAYVQVSEIPKKAKVSQGTFYNHFSDKTDVFLEFSKEICDEIDQYWRERVTTDPSNLRQFLNEGLVAVARYSLRHPTLISTLAIDVQTLKPANPNDPRIPELRWAQNWTEILLAAKGEADRKPTLDEILIGYTCQHIVASMFSFSYHETDGQKRLLGRTIEHLMRILSAEIEHAYLPSLAESMGRSDAVAQNHFMN